MVIYWYLSPAMHIEPNPNRKGGKVYRPLHPWGVGIINKMAEYLRRHNGENVDAVLFYSKSEMVMPVWLEVVMGHESLRPMFTSAEKEILSTPQEVNASLRKSHQHAGKTVLVIATEKSDLAKIENVSGASKISLFLNLIGEGGGGLTKIRHESKNFREDWALI